MWAAVNNGRLTQAFYDWNICDWLSVYVILLKKEGNNQMVVYPTETLCNKMGTCKCQKQWAYTMLKRRHKLGLDVHVLLCPCNGRNVFSITMNFPRGLKNRINIGLQSKTVCSFSTELRKNFPWLSLPAMLELQ